MMKVVSHTCNRSQRSCTVWTLEWHLGRKATLQSVWFFTEAEAKAARDAVTAHCANHGVDPSHLPRAAVAILIEALQRGNDAIVFVSANKIALGNRGKHRAAPKGSVH